MWELILNLTNSYQNGNENITKDEFDSQIQEYELAKGVVGDAAVERLENIEPFILRCEIPIDTEKTYYDTVTDILIETRGHGTYANCK